MREGWDRTPPLLAECLRAGRNPLGSLRFQAVLGWVVIVVPLRLLPYRGAARVTVGVMVAAHDIRPEDIHDLRVRTVDGEPSWTFAVRSADVPELASAVGAEGSAA